MKYVFQKNEWFMEGLVHAGSVRFPSMPEFAQRDNYIENQETPASKDGYAYISLVTKEKLQPGVQISTHCAFENRAAPLIVLPKKLIEKDGNLFYEDYLEVVLWKHGINVWNLWMGEDGTVQIRNLLRLEQPVEAGVIHDLSVKIKRDSFVITLDGSRVALYCDAIYDSFHLGITGCEGPCRFYDMTIEENK